MWSSTGRGPHTRWPTRSGSPASPTPGSGGRSANARRARSEPDVHSAGRAVVADAGPQDQLVLPLRRRMAVELAVPEDLSEALERPPAGHDRRPVAESDGQRHARPVSHHIPDAYRLRE